MSKPKEGRELRPCEKVPHRSPDVVMAEVLSGENARPVGGLRTAGEDIGVK
jgi:hypothetical protein